MKKSAIDRAIEATDRALGITQELAEMVERKPYKLDSISAEEAERQRGSNLMSEMIEHVAKSMRSHEWDGGDQWETIDRSEKQYWSDAARIAIEAMRLPTEKMLDRLDMANSGWGTRLHSKELWQELIDEALK